MALVNKKIQIDSEKVILPPGQNIRHVSTSYQISLTVGFEQNNIVHEKIRDTKNLYRYVVDVELDDTKNYFVRTRFHYTVNGANKDGTWTRAIMLDSKDSNDTMSAYIVTTPKLTTNYIPQLDQLTVSTSEFKMFAGKALHGASSYAITNSDNEVIYNRDKDVDNLTSIDIQGVIQPHKVYNVQAAHIDDLGNSSFFGRNLLFNYSRYSKLFSFEIAEKFVIDRKLYFKIGIFTPKYKSYDLEIRDINNDTIIQVHDENKWTKNTISYLDLNDKTICVEGKALEVTKEYIFYLKLYFTDNTETKFEEVYRGRLEFNRLTTYKPLVKYSNRRVKGNDIDTSGITCVTTRELFDGKIINSQFENNKLGLYTNEPGKHIKIKDLFDFTGLKLGVGFEETDSLQVDYMNIFQLPTHDILIDVCVYNTNKQSKTIFMIFEYDPFRLALSKNYVILPRDNEMYTTALCNSLAITVNNDIFYVPGHLTNGKNETRQDLILYKWNALTDFFTKRDNVTTNPDPDTGEESIPTQVVYDLKATEYKLPFQAKCNVGVFTDQENNIYVFGGSVTPRYMAKTNEEYWTRENNSIYKLPYDKTNKTYGQFTKVVDFPAQWSVDIYAMQAFLRVDGTVALFNASVAGPEKDVQDIIVFNPKNNTLTKANTDHTWDIPFRSNIIYANGNIERISSKEKDPQKSVIFVANTQPPGSVDVDGNIIEPEELIVEDAEIVNIEDIYKYKKITIKGTGILRWYRPQGVTDIDSNCLIVNKEMLFEEADFTNAKYQSVLILDTEFKDAALLIQG